MNLKRVFTVSAGAAVVVVPLLFILATSHMAAGHVNIHKLVSAVERYRTEAAQRATPKREYVSVAELVRLGYLKTSDVRGLAGTESVIYLDRSENLAHAALMRVTLKDGQELALLGDGSVRQVK